MCREQKSESGYVVTGRLESGNETFLLAQKESFGLISTLSNQDSGLLFMYGEICAILT